MMRSLYSGITGLRNHQTRMDVIGNNIANVNTIGYKSSRVVFQDVFNQTSNLGSANTGVIGGTNPIQVGLGMRLSTIDVIHNPAPAQLTERPLDAMINGDGMFIVEGPEGFYYTRAGNFYLDDEGYLVTSQGYYVMGWVSVDDILVGEDEGDFDYDDYAFGVQREPDNEWVIVNNMLLRAEDVARCYQWGAVGSHPMNVAVTELNPDDATYVLSRIRLITANLDPDTGEPVVEWENTYFPDPARTPEDILHAAPQGKELTQFNIEANGTVGVLYNNLPAAISQLAVAVFSNYGGLDKAGGSLYRETRASGGSILTIANDQGAGDFTGGALEMSSVDLAAEFTDMIVTQRGFQANSRIITVSDTMLEELVNLKR